MLKMSHADYTVFEQAWLKPVSATAPSNVRYQPNRYAETSQTTLMNNTFNILIGDNQLILPTLPDNSVDSIVTDPPYELGFMGKRWDGTGIAFDPATWEACLRVLKPGGHLSIADLDRLLDHIGALDGVERTLSSVILSTRISR